ncbi:TonB-dependent receptor [Desulfosarcina ovata]|uniref:Iron-regulated outer membrane virulence protein n=1 Tax=Desulfosarcina ovata subsp. ovata TaxID=2752305 RepID=A0A5K8A9A4_9BACT|nr:TonB-dependent receptor [Desulfosarcina ovata]BBO89066.1 iron-regulated outer membrane virulence protein [Desulfosarcina ovata subsp. ovata]
MQWRWKQRNGMRILLLWLFGLIFVGTALAEESSTHKLDDVVVSEQRILPEISQTPQKTTIDVDTYETVGTMQNIGDILKDQPIMDFRGASDLVPGDIIDGEDAFWMRGFGSNRFVTAIDGSNIHKAGGRQSYHVVDYSLLPTFLIEEVEILPGPHSALYPAQSIGGVINLVTRTPERYDTIKPQVHVSTGYKSYNTQNHSITARGGIDDFVYDAGYQRYSTDGYLRHSEADIDSTFGHIGYLLPSTGYITLTVNHSQGDREIPVNNDAALGDDDGGYPTVSESSYFEWQSPEYDGTATAFRLNYLQPSPLGEWDLNAYYSEEEWKRTTLRKDASGIIYDGGWESTWYTRGVKLQDTIRFSDAHETVIGAEVQQFLDSFDTKQGSPAAFDEKKRVETRSGFAQHRWRIIPRLTLTAGLRYEHADTWTNNLSSSTGAFLITGQPRWIERNFDDWLPKSFITYDLDDLAAGLRDTSVSVGVSRIWRAPTNFGDFNYGGRPVGPWTEPEHGIGYDVVLSRRLVNDIQLKVNYAYYEIEDYLAWNGNFSKYTPGGGNSVTPGMEYKDYVINLEKIVRHGVEVQLSGHLMDDLSFYLGYAYQKFENKGGELAGEDAVDDIAKNRVNAGLRYRLFENTTLLLDYKYQDEQVVQKAEEVAPDEWEFSEIPMDAYHVFDLAVRQTLFKKWGFLENATLKVYINNLLDENYENLSGYPATDRTYGAALDVYF